MLARAANELANSEGLDEELARHIADLDIKIGRFARWLEVARQTRQSVEKLELS